MRLRITFSKQGPLRYTGHLDLHKIWERAARRAQLPLAYSQGFHPHPQIQLAAALPLGFSSRCELVDLKLNETLPLDGLVERIQAAVPAGLHILQVEAVDERAPALQTQVVSAEFEVILLDEFDLEEVGRKLAAIMAATSLPRVRRNKPYDLRPLLEKMELHPEAPQLRMTLAAREGATGRPEEVLEALGIPLESTRVERSRLIFK